MGDTERVNPDEPKDAGAKDPAPTHNLILRKNSKGQIRVFLEDGIQLAGVMRLEVVQVPGMRSEVVLRVIGSEVVFREEGE